MNVCLLNDSFPPLTDGVANTVINYGDVITRNYGKAIVAVPSYPDVDDSGYNFEVVRYNSLDTTRLVGYRAGNPFDSKSIERLKAFKPDIIHSHCPIASSFMARELRGVTGVPLVFTYHTKFDYDIRRVVKLKLIQESMIRAIIANISASDDVWVVSHGAGENLRSLGYEGDYHVMPNGVGYPKEKASADGIRALRDRWNIPADKPVFLFVGRMLWYKGQKYILDALRILKDEGHSFRMVFVGGGDDLEEMRAYAALLGIGEECLFTGTELDKEVLRSWYTMADLFLLPSVFDNNPIVVKEAAACSTASVLIRGSSSAEGIEDGVNGLLMEEDAGSLASKLRLVFEQPGLTARLGEKASDDLYCSWEDSIARAVKRYEEVIYRYRDGGVRLNTRHEFPINMISNLHNLFYHK